VNEAAALLRRSLVTLGRWRIQGRHKFGRRVVYSRDDLLAWAQPRGRT
jgi:Helix-turn-helix domain